MLRVSGDIGWTPAARLYLINQSIFLTGLKEKQSTNLGLSSILSTLWSSFFKFSLSVIKFEFFFYSSVREVHLIYIKNCMRRIKDEKIHRKTSYTFLNKTVPAVFSIFSKPKEGRTLLFGSTYQRIVIVNWHTVICFL